MVHGHPVNMSCDVTGVPTPEVTWTQDGVAVSEEGGGGRRVSEDGRILELTGATVKDSGAYACIAQNVAGVDRKLFNLHVLGALTPSTEMSGLLFYFT